MVPTTYEGNQETPLIVGKAHLFLGKFLYSFLILEADPDFVHLFISIISNLQYMCPQAISFAWIQIPNVTHSTHLSNCCDLL